MSMTEKTESEEQPGASTDENTSTPLEGTEAAGQEPAQKTEDDKDNDSELDARVKAANEEAKKYRLRLREVEQELEAVKSNESDENKTLAERLQKLEDRLQEGQQKLQEANLQHQLDKAAQEHGIKNMRLLKAAIALEGDIEFDDNDQPVDLADTIQKVVDANPELAKPARRGGAVNPPRSRGDGALTVENYRAMNRQEKFKAMTEHPQEVQKILEQIASRS